MIEILIDSTTRMILGVGPFDPGTQADPGYAIDQVDASQQTALDQDDPAYLSLDGLSVIGSPP